MRTDLVCEGGGSKLPALIGSYAALKDRGFEISHAAGTSAGAIFASAAVSGYSPDELKRLIDSLNFTDFLDNGRWSWQKGWNLLRHLGLYKGKKFEEFMTRILAERGVHTFGDLKYDSTDSRYKWRLKVVAADITRGRLLTFPDDAILFDTDPDDMPVAKAVRMSMGIPFFFRPYKWGESYIVDGGVLSNFPISLFDSDEMPDHPTFGLILKEANFNQPHEISGFRSLCEALIRTMIEAHDRRSIRPGDFFHRTIAIPTGDVSTLDFDISKGKKEWLYRSGYLATTDFLNNWSWETYKNWASIKRRLK